MTTSCFVFCCKKLKDYLIAKHPAAPDVSVMIDLPEAMKDEKHAIFVKLRDKGNNVVGGGEGYPGLIS